MTKEIGHFISGKRVAGGSGRSGDVFNPTTGDVQGRSPFATKAEVTKAIDAAEEGLSRPGPRRTRKGARA